MMKRKGGNEMKVIILGGSFNPPTIAHLQLMKDALDAIEADLGIFMPVQYSYIRQKLKKAGKKKDMALSNELRFAMLQELCKEDTRMTVDDYEMNQEQRCYNYETLLYLKEQYPDAEFYSLIGGDKLHIIPRWRNASKLLREFKVLVAKRNGEQPEDVIDSIPFLEELKDSFTIFSISDEMDLVSSSAFREKVKNGEEDAKNMVVEGVWKILEQNGKIVREGIDEFRGEYYFLSNFYPVDMEFEGIPYQNSEAAFQAQKCLTEEEKWQFVGLPSNKAKRLGRQVQLRPDWEEVKVGLMEQIVRAKFEQHPELMELLVATGDKPLIEGNTWNDRFWGMDLKTRQGENHLGKILMKIREENN